VNTGERPVGAEGQLVKYMLLIWQNPTNWAGLGPDDFQAIHTEYGAYTQAIMDSKEFVAGDPLQGNDTATTVRVERGNRIVSDGPFVETKEWLAGFYTVEVPDLDRALQLAEAIPGAKRGLDTIEVRPIMEM
jgi:hypothetical protein